MKVKAFPMNPELSHDQQPRCMDISRSLKNSILFFLNHESNRISHISFGGPPIHPNYLLKNQMTLTSHEGFMAVGP